MCGTCSNTITGAVERGAIFAPRSSRTPVHSRKCVIDDADFFHRFDILKTRLGITKKELAEKMAVSTSGIDEARRLGRSVSANTLSRLEAIESGATVVHSKRHSGRPCEYSYARVTCAANRDFRMRTDRIMAQLKINQKQFAGRMGFSHAFINEVRNGRRRVSERAIQRLEAVEKEAKKWFTAT